MKSKMTFIALSALMLAQANVPAQGNGPAQGNQRTVARLFWQDSASQTMRWGDLKQGNAWTLMAQDLEGFPKLDSERQSHVQMQQADGVLVTGIHDTEDGKFQSGWVAIESGVSKEEHGDHFHWHFAAQPRVSVTRLDDQQGNPAHVYKYNDRFYLANDKKDGFTVIAPSGLRQNGGAAADKFFSAGGGHITLAAINNSVAYSTWIDREGENLGRIDVVGLNSNGQTGYSFFLPSGGIHGATTNSGRLFFAPSDGVCWVDGDPTLSKSPEGVQVNHLSLGEDAAGNPLRTGAFTNHRNYVLFNAGRGSEATLCLVDATSAKPLVQKVGLAVADGASVSTPVAIRTRTGEDLALLFQESADGASEEKLLVVDLDPNRDGNCSDAKLSRTIVVGKSQIEGHSGHHEIAALAGGRFIAITNPGDGTVWIVSLANFTTAAKLNVGGTPTRILAVGG